MIVRDGRRVRAGPKCVRFVGEISVDLLGGGS